MMTRPAEGREGEDEEMLNLSKMYVYLLLATLIVAGTPASVQAFGGIDIAAAVGGELLSVDRNRVKVAIGGVTITAFLESGDPLAVNDGYVVPAKLPWGVDLVKIQMPLSAVGLPIRSAKLRVNGHEIGVWLPEARCFLVKASEYAALYRRLIGEQVNAGFNTDPTVLPQLDHEAVFTMVGGDRKEYTVTFVIIPLFRIVTERDVKEGAGFTLQFQNTDRWNPAGDADFHRPEAELRAEIEDWFDAGTVTGFEPYGVDPARKARARERSQQVRNGATVTVRVRYEESDGSLAKYVLPGTCLYWWLPEELVLTDTQLAVTLEDVPGQEYIVLPPGREPYLPSHWSETVRKSLTGLRCVMIRRTTDTGAEVNFEVPFGVLDLAPAIQRQVTGPDGKPMLVVLANFLVLGSSQSLTTGEAFLWHYVQGSDLVSLPVANRPTQVKIVLRSHSSSDRASEETADPVPTIGQE